VTAEAFATGDNLNSAAFWRDVAVRRQAHGLARGEDPDFTAIDVNECLERAGLIDQVWGSGSGMVAMMEARASGMSFDVALLVATEP
jgi:hypothetical protein